MSDVSKRLATIEKLRSLICSLEVVRIAGDGEGEGVLLLFYRRRDGPGRLLAVCDISMMTSFSGQERSNDSMQEGCGCDSCLRAWNSAGFWEITCFGPRNPATPATPATNAIHETLPVTA
jgi:hypothetical protein